MGKLIYSMIMSLDGYVADEAGDFSWAEPNEAVHRFVNDTVRSVSCYLYGRRMYEMMVYWETAHTIPDQPDYERDFTRMWQAADKVVFSRTLSTAASGRTRIEREFDPELVRRLKAETDGDLTVDGPHLAAQAIRAGLVDEYHQLIAPVMVGGGTRYFPEGVRLDLTLLDERRFDNGVVYLRYGTR